MSIQNELDKIKNAVYGREVRGAIHDGIYKMNAAVQENTRQTDETKDKQRTLEQQFDDVQQNATVDSPSDVEIVSARINGITGENHDTLSNRIDYDYGVTKDSVNNVAKKASLINHSLNGASKKKEPTFAVIADDAPKNDLEKIVPIMIEKNIPIGFGVVTSMVGKTTSSSAPEMAGIEFMTWDDLRYVQENGGEILSHSHTHRNMMTLTTDELHTEMSESKRILNENGFAVEGFVYPYNAVNPPTKAVTSQYYDYGFTGVNSVYDTGDNFRWFDNHEIARIGVGSYFDQPEEGFPQDTSSLAYLKARVDWSIENNNLMVMTLHSLRDTFPAEQQEIFRQIIDYIRSKGYDIVSPSQAFARYGNIIQVGWEGQSNHTMIDADGFKRGTRRFVADNYDAHTTDDDIDDFENQTVTYTPISKPLPSGPVNDKGILKTVKLAGESQYIYQVYKVNVYEITPPYHGYHRDYYRYWVRGQWSPWTTNQDISETKKNVTIPQIPAHSSKYVDLYNMNKITDTSKNITVTIPDLPGHFNYTVLAIDGSRIRLLMTNISSEQQPEVTVDIKVTTSI